MGISLKRFFLQNFDVGRQSQVRTLTPNFSIANLLETGFFLHCICLARARTSDMLRYNFATRFSTKKSYAGRKGVANPHELVENLVGRKPGLQLARIMECSLKGTSRERYAPGRSRLTYDAAQRGRIDAFLRRAHICGLSKELITVELLVEQCLKRWSLSALSSYVTPSQ